jgi:hypothetical protein
VLALALALLVAAQQAAPAASSAAAPLPLPKIEAAFEHDLASPTGVIPLTWPSLSHDRAHHETFVVAEGFARIFDASGMEVHRFGDDGSLGQVARVVALDSDELVVLLRGDGRHHLVRCDFRGEPIEPFELKNLPPELLNFDPDQLVARNGKVYLAERGSMRVVVAEPSGVVVRWYRLRDLVMAAIPQDAETRGAPSMDAFNVDAEGNLLATMSILYAGAVVSPSGEVRLFGTRGSRPGKFNIIGGIDADEAGNVYVTDRLRSVVSVWDRQLRHLGEFGYRGSDPWNLLTPYEIAVGNGQIFVAQAGKKGVKVFRVQIVEPPPPPPDAEAIPSLRTKAGI